MLQYICAGLSDRGQVRPQNEDNWFAKSDLGLFGVSDGMGGHQAGALASQIVVESLPSLLARVLKDETDLSRPDVIDAVKTALSDLSDEVRNQSGSHPELAGMGATIVAAIIREQQLIIAHMGDSRAYLFRNGELSRLTRDHTMTQLLVEAGELTADQIASHPSRSSLIRYVGMQTESLPEAKVFPDLVAGDKLLLCSDGLTGKVSDKDIADILDKYPVPDDACQALITGANKSGGDDNITAVIISVGESRK